MSLSNDAFLGRKITKDGSLPTANFLLITEYWKSSFDKLRMTTLAITRPTALSGQTGKYP
jgi:hypothetical protein